jgi:hypothetical protein
VPPERIARWLAGFGERHGALTGVDRGPEVVRFTAADGATAECHVPFPPLAPRPAHESPAGDARTGDARTGDAKTGNTEARDAQADDVVTVVAETRDEAARALIEHALCDRLVGVLLVRLGGHAAGIFDGERLVTSKVGSRLVHGRSAAGGWSQHRFARRRDNQAREALEDAANVAVRVLEPHLTRLDAVVLGGDRRALDGLRADPRLSPVFALATGPVLTVPDPRLAVLRETPRTFRCVRIRLSEPPE